MPRGSYRGRLRRGRSRRCWWSSHEVVVELNGALCGLDPAAVPADRPVVAVCRSGNRSEKAALLLAGAGRNVSNMAGGMKAWDEAGLPMVTDDGPPGRV